MKIGAQLYTVRNFIQTPEGVAETFRKIADIGYKYVQVSAIGPIAAERLGEIAKENGLEIVITHTSPDRILNETAQVIAEHRQFGCSNIGIGYMPEQYHGKLEGYRQFIKDFDRAAHEIADAGMQLYYHNHNFEFGKENGVTFFDFMVSETDPKAWAFLLDTYWVQMGGRTPAVQLEALAGRTKIVHLKDLAIVGEEQRMAPVLEGNLDFASFFTVCDKIGVEYAMVEQDLCYELDPFAALAKSYENLKKAGF